MTADNRLPLSGWMVGEIDGHRTLTGLLPIAEQMPPELRDAIAARNIVNTGGVCPTCGVSMTLPNRATRRRAKRTGATLHAVAEHDESCPACDANIAPMIAAWTAR